MGCSEEQFWLCDDRNYPSSLGAGPMNYRVPLVLNVRGYSGVAPLGRWQ